MCQAVGARMVAAQGRSIVNVGSIYGMVSRAGHLRVQEGAEGRALCQAVAYSAGIGPLQPDAVTSRPTGASRASASTRIAVRRVSRHAGSRPFSKTTATAFPSAHGAGDESTAISSSPSDASKYMTGANVVMDGVDIGNT